MSASRGTLPAGSHRASSLPTERSWGNSWPAGGITSTELADEAVTSSKIAPDAVQPQHLALEAVYGGLAEAVAAIPPGGLLLQNAGVS